MAMVLFLTQITGVLYIIWVTAEGNYEVWWLSGFGSSLGI